MKLCSKCHIEKPLSDYYVKNGRTGQLHAQCKDCYKHHRRSYYHAHYEKYKEQYRKRAVEYRRSLRDEFRQNMLKYLKNKICVVCGENDIRTFEFDHIVPSKKKFTISQSVRLGYRWGQVELELEKCRILCANCHKKHTSAQSSWYKNI